MLRSFWSNRSTRSMVVEICPTRSRMRFRSLRNWTFSSRRILFSVTSPTTLK